MNATAMDEQARKDPKLYRLSEVLEKEYEDLGVIIRVEGDFPGFPYDDSSRLKAVYQQVARERPLSALCISGGGIRSATFALGVMQGLARAKLLRRFDYLSTVSGGGYIGSWLSAWISRSNGGVEEVESQLGKPAADTEKSTDPIHHLREYNSYLTPQTGMASTDTWTLGTIVLRNLLLNWCLMIPLLMLFLMLPRLFTAALQLSPPGNPAPPIVTEILKWVAGGLFCFATVNVFRSLPSVGGTNVSERHFKRHCFAPLLGAVFCFVIWCWWNWDGPKSVDALIGRPAVLTGCVYSLTLASWLVYALVYARRKGIRAAASLLVGPVTIGVLIFGASTGAGVYACMAWLVATIPIENANPAVYATLAPALFTLASVIGGVVFVGVTSFHLGEDDREWLSRAAAHFCMFTAAWLVICSIVLLAPPYLFQLPDMAKSAVAAVGGISGIATAVLGWSTRTVRQATPASESKPSLLAQWLPGVTMLAFVVVLMVFLSAGSNWLVVSAHSVLAPLVGGETHEFHWQEHDDLIVAGMLAGKFATALTLLVISLIAGRFININRFSLHGMYRNRLVRAYLGASNKDRDGKSGFTGFNPKDNVAFHNLRGQKPLHVVNAALNLVGGKRLDWQQRKAESFVFSPWYCGSSHTGYRNSRNYAGGVTLGSAVTISGAAASPNMGYHSSPLVGLVMMLFNARLGAWFGNPGEAGEHTWTHDGPQSAVSPVVREAAGITTDSGKYIYLSDGGHFENLALYEMVMRRCREIVVIDGGCDEDYSYEDLGNALRKIRIDFGIDIDFPNDFITGLRKKERRCALARIRYSAAGEGPDGTLLYIKPVITGDESPDVLTYRSTSPAFPHESTSDQWFTEAQTESYRMLGLHTVESMTRGWQGEDLSSFLDHACSCYLSADIRTLTASAS